MPQHLPLTLIVLTLLSCEFVNLCHQQVIVFVVAVVVFI